jgi:DNA-binding transcriptional LysR family regulator
LVEGLDDELLAMLRARELDLVVSRLPPGVEGLEAEPLTLSDWALITHPKHALARRVSVTLDEVPADRWVLPAGGSAFRRQMETVFSAAALPWPTAGVSTNSILAIKAIVMNTGGVTIMSPVLVEVEIQAGRLCAVPLKDLAPLQPIGMMWRSGEELSPTAARLAKVLRFVAAEGNG